ncbi:uncharacterized protein LOC127284873 isoform X2 [Leptopilina boulardi]|uniref:uncharacterized protein LOC127284873 isoform X1 n=1 Tax=Leptopilina boulardi TaxID=63433 RepID=UPI0021F5F198|nr:uncharacterized protein LOC127284873 isoform X1 [Leptopilina boulardi]XP_051166530.1 uncharacterized protein LOC127284873 isoform X2 [Leptopilina boulardi]
MNNFQIFSILFGILLITLISSDAGTIKSLLKNDLYSKLLVKRSPDSDSSSSDSSSSDSSSSDSCEDSSQYSVELCCDKEETTLAPGPAKESVESIKKELKEKQDELVVNKKIELDAQNVVNNDARKLDEVLIQVHALRPPNANLDDSVTVHGYYVNELITILENNKKNVEKLDNAKKDVKTLENEISDIIKKLSASQAI